MRKWIVAAILPVFAIYNQSAAQNVHDETLAGRPGNFSIQFSPVSFKAWGSTPSTVSLQVEYKWIMLGYYHIYGHYRDEFKSPTKSNTIALFYKPDLKLGNMFTVAPMLGLFNHRFPTENAAWWAFGINIGLNATPRLAFYYQHFSNGGTARLNPGLDVLGIKYTL